MVFQALFDVFIMNDAVNVRRCSSNTICSTMFPSCEDDGMKYGKRRKKERKFEITIKDTNIATSIDSIQLLGMLVLSTCIQTNAKVACFT